MKDMAESTILVIDDTEVNLDLIEAILSDEYHVSTTKDGETGLAIAAAIHPDMILLDVMMPGMDGPQTLEQLVNLVDINVVPVAFMTAKVQPAEVEHYRSLGARDVIIKPFDPMQLASQIRAIWSLSNG